jgi:hypothetical protein
MAMPSPIDPREHPGAPPFEYLEAVRLGWVEDDATKALLTTGERLASAHDAYFAARAAFFVSRGRHRISIIGDDYQLMCDFDVTTDGWLLARLIESGDLDEELLLATDADDERRREIVDLRRTLVEIGEGTRLSAERMAELDAIAAIPDNDCTATERYLLARQGGWLPADALHGFRIPK